MPDIDFGSLLQGGVKSFNEARVYNLAVARAKTSAGIRLRQMELDEREQELSKQLQEQALAEGRIKTQAEKLDLEAREREAQRELRGQKFLNMMNLKVAKTKEGRPVGAAEAYGIEDIEPKRKAAREMAGLPERETVEERDRRVRGEEAGIAYTKAQTKAAGRKLTEEKPLTTADKRLVWDELKSFLGGDRVADLKPEELREEINALGRQRFPERWVDYPVLSEKVIKGWIWDDKVPTFVPTEVPSELQEYFE